MASEEDPYDDEETTTDEDDDASQTTEDDPQIAEPQHARVPVPAPAPVIVPASTQPQQHSPPASTGAPPPPATNGAARDRPHYTLMHTMSGHSKSISAVKFSPDGTMLASCGTSVLQTMLQGVQDLV